MAGNRTFSIIAFISCSVLAAAATFSSFVRQTTVSAWDALTAFSRSIRELAVYALDYVGRPEMPARLDVPAEIGRQSAALANVRSFSAHRRARFDRGHVDQGWLAAA